MDLLNNEMRTVLARKLIFAINFMMTTQENFFDKFNLVILDSMENKVVRFDLYNAEDTNMCISFKRLGEREFQISYQLINKEDGTVHSFKLFTDDKEENVEYNKTVVDLFELVNEKARQDQYDSLEKSLNKLLF